MRTALCWRVKRTDGGILRATNHDRDILVTASGFVGRYRATAGISATLVRSTADLAVDNLEVSGAVNVQTGIKLNEIEAGVWDEATVAIFEVDWEAPYTARVLHSGIIGEIERTAELQYKAESRSLSQLLQQSIGETYQPTCRADLGSGAEVPLIKRCGVDISLYTFDGTVDFVYNSRQFILDINSSDTPAAGYFKYGIVTFTTGANAGFRREVKSHLFDGTVSMFEEFPEIPEIGDLVTITAGCDKLFATCKAKFDNGDNFRGEPFVPGIDFMSKGAS